MGLEFSPLPVNSLFSLNPTVHSLVHFLRPVDRSSSKNHTQKNIERKALTTVSHRNGWTRSADKHRPCEGGHCSWEALGRLPASLLTMQTPAERPRMGGGGDQNPECGQSPPGGARCQWPSGGRSVWSSPVAATQGIDPLAVER